MPRASERWGAAAGSPAEVGVQKSGDVASIGQTAQTLRAQFTADHTRRALAASGRWSGLNTLVAGLRRRLQHHRTLQALTQLDDRLVNDIGVSRFEIDDTAALCCDAQPEAPPSVWHRLGARMRRRRRPRTPTPAPPAHPAPTSHGEG